MKTLIAAVLSLATATLATPAAPRFVVASPDIAEGRSLGQDQVFNSMGCSGANLSPTLGWKDAPAGTKSFAVTVYDPDAPTGSGWWHWLVYDIPAAANGLPAGIGTKAALPAGAVQGRNDGGARAFGGACPLDGKKHHYVFTVYALKVDKLGIPEDASAAMIGFMLNMNALAKSTITATYAR